jgi:hypothetical protein
MASSSHLQPGEEGKITAKVATKNRLGSLSKHVKVFSNDPQRPIVSLSLKAHIEAK